MTNLATETIRAKSWQYLGSVPAAIALGCADIGTAVLEDGTTVYVTWGRNLDREQQEYFAYHTKFQPIHLGSSDGTAELIIPRQFVELLIPVLILP